MSVAKVIEITAASETGFEDAVRVGLRRAAKTVENITGPWVKEQKVVVESGQITEFRVNVKVAFLLKD